MKAEENTDQAEFSSSINPVAASPWTISESVSTSYRGIHQLLADVEYWYPSERDSSARWVVDS